VKALVRRALDCLAVLSFVLLCLAVWGSIRSGHDGDRWEWKRHDRDDTGSRTETRAVVSRAGTLTFTHWVANFDWDESRGIPHQPWKYQRTDGRHEAWMSQMLPPDEFLGVKRYIFFLGYTVGRQIDVPYWMPCGSFAILPAAVGTVRLRKWVRGPAPGVCAGCGYDLRASPGRCPECGRAVQPAAGTVTS